MPKLTEDLLGNGTSEAGLLTILHNMSQTFCPSGSKLPSFPAHAPSLVLSEQEVTQNGPYTEDTHQKHMEYVWSKVQELLQLIRKACHTGKRKKPKTKLVLPTARELVSLAHSLQSSGAFAHLLSLVKSNKRSSVLLGVRKVGSYWRCALELKRCARLIGHSKIQFVAIPKSKEVISPPQQPVGSDSISMIKNLLKPIGYSIRDFGQTAAHRSALVEAFTQYLHLPSAVHPEINLIYFYGMHPDLDPKAEIGLSQQACFACSRFIKHHSYFDIKTLSTAARGRYTSWGVPADRSLNSGSGVESI